MSKQASLVLGCLALGLVLVLHGCGGSHGGSSSSTATNNNPAILSPPGGTALPDAAVGTAYLQTFTVTSGGTAPYTFNISGTPSGLSFAAITTFSCTISGTPTAQGAGTIQLLITDATGAQTFTDYTLTVDGPGGALAMTPTSPPAGKLGVNYTFTFAVVGGTAPFNFSLTQGSLPSGLTLGPAASGVNGQAQISGTAGSQGTYPYVITVKDSSSPQKSGSQSFSIVVN